MLSQKSRLFPREKFFPKHCNSTDLYIEVGFSLLFKWYIADYYNVWEIIFLSLSLLILCNLKESETHVGSQRKDRDTPIVTLPKTSFLTCCCHYFESNRVCTSNEIGLEGGGYYFEYIQ